MRIVTWNCQMGFDKKAGALLSLRPDVAVILECSQSAATAFEQHGFESLWFGSNPHKGVGVFSRKGWALRALSQPKHQWIVPIRVRAPEPFTLLAVWACRTGNKKADNYIGQVYQALQSYPQWFNRSPMILAGDLNSNQVWDHERRVGNHSDVVKILADRGLVSSYHEFFGEAQGAESLPTHYLYRHAHRPFHLDYIFIPRAWLPGVKSVVVGKHKTWSKLSDHCPVVVEV